MSATTTALPAGMETYHRRAGRPKSNALAFDLGHLESRDFTRADLVFDGVDHAGPSYEARVFLNNKGADADTPRTLDQGYAGSFHIFGHGSCFGDVGHCDVDERGKDPYDLRLPHPLTPARKLVIVTEALKQILQRDGKLESVTVVPVAYGQATTGETDPEGFLKYDKVQLLTYD
jgi:hypothetical protein